jgi:hypothetical protein
VIVKVNHENVCRVWKQYLHYFRAGSLHRGKFGYEIIKYFTSFSNVFLVKVDSMILKKVRMLRRPYSRAAQAVHITQCAKMCAAQPARVQMMQRHGPACS